MKQVRVGVDASNWKGGYRCVGKQGYVNVYTGCNASDNEHRVVAERALGHALPPRAEVHHWDENKSNNTPSNLVICEDRAYHMLLHARKRRLQEFGSLALKRCRVCKVVKALSEFGNDSKWDGKSYVCKPCASKRRQERKVRRRTRERTPNL